MFNSVQLVSMRLHHFIGSWLAPDAVVIDLGANRGYFAQEVNAAYGCTCYALEAMPDLYAAIPQTEKIRPFHYAIAPTNAPITFNVSDQEESGSVHALPTAMITETITVPGITLTQFMADQGIDQVDLLKVDIEGAEIDLFQTLPDATLGKIKQIAVEFHDFLDYFEDDGAIAAIKARLESLGFACIVYSLTCHADVLFINRALAPLSAWDYFYLGTVDKYRRGITHGIRWRLEKWLGREGA